MKTLIAALLACGIILVPSQTDAGQRTKVAFVGDSITWGAYLDDPTTQAFPAVAARILGKRARVSVFAQPGIRLDQTDLGPILATRPDVLVINLGVNDLNQGYPVEGVQAGLLAVKQAAKKARVRLFVMTISPIYGEVLNPWIRATFRTIDTAPVMVMFGDNIHPNVAGHEAMGRLVDQKIERKLR